MANILSERRPEEERLLTTGEVAAVFRVDPRTVTRWTREGRLKSIRTPGNQHRYHASAVQALLGKQAEGVLA